MYVCTHVCTLHMYVRSLADLFLYPCTPPTASVSRSFGLRSSYEIAILDTDLKTHLRALSEPYTTKPPLDFTRFRIVKLMLITQKDERMTPC